jgi:DNA-binding transcriptional MerR regulator
LKKKTHAKLYYSISEVSELAKVKPHVLRYWETQFKMLRPRKNRAGNRMYREKDLELVLAIRTLLYEKGFTIVGARRKLLTDRREGAPQVDLAFQEAKRSALMEEIREELRALVDLARDARGRRARPVS